MNWKKEFGKTGECRLTGFRGIITGVAHYMTGCSQVCLTPECTNGDYKDSHWFDEGKIAIRNDVPAKKVESVTSDEPGCDMPAPNVNR